MSRQSRKAGVIALVGVVIAATSPFASIPIDGALGMSADRWTGILLVVAFVTIAVALFVAIRHRTTDA